MKRFIRYFCVPFICLGTVVGPAYAVSAPSKGLSSAPMKMGAETRTLKTTIVFRHGDISWLPELAAEAGWPKRTYKRLAAIILRESGGCPNRIGGDIVDENCNVTGVSEWSHRSDSGLLQINGVHWKKDHADYVGLVCKQMGVCNQEQLLDPVTNLRAGKLLFDVAGWSPWFSN